MYEYLDDIHLKSGESVEMGVVISPDLHWAKQLEKLLHHKRDPWNWQNSEVLRSHVEIEVYYYVLHRDGAPFSNIMTAELHGVGILGHVWTNPKDRRKGAISQLMQRQMEHFCAREGKALFLGTDFDSPPYYIYRKYGFRNIEDKSGCMEYYSTSKEEFLDKYFTKGETTIQEVDWPHWPSSPALFIGDFPGIVRCAPLRLMGRNSTEGPFLRLICGERKRRAEGENPHAKVLVNKRTSAVVGLAAWEWDPLWPDTCLVDIYCHPNYWEKAGELFAALPLPETDRYLAYSESTFMLKQNALEAAGFGKTATFAKRIAVNRVKSDFLDIFILEK
jgi:hypothetical protein